VCSQSRFPCDCGVRSLLSAPANFSVCYDVCVVARTLAWECRTSTHCLLVAGMAVCYESLVDGDISLPPYHARSPLPLQHLQHCSVYGRSGVPIVSWDILVNKWTGNRRVGRVRLLDWRSSFSHSHCCQTILRHTQFQFSGYRGLSSREYRE
jgi:hypothetical protein